MTWPDSLRRLKRNSETRSLALGNPDLPAPPRETQARFRIVFVAGAELLPGVRVAVVMG